MNSTSWNQSASPLYQKLQILKFNNILKLQLANIMHSVHNDKINFKFVFWFLQGRKFSSLLH